MAFPVQLKTLKSRKAFWLCQVRTLVRSAFWMVRKEVRYVPTYQKKKTMITLFTTLKPGGGFKKNIFHGIVSFPKKQSGVDQNCFLNGCRSIFRRMLWKKRPMPSNAPRILRILSSKFQFLSEFTCVTLYALQDYLICALAIFLGHKFSRRIIKNNRISKRGW